MNSETLQLRITDHKRDFDQTIEITPGKARPALIMAPLDLSTFIQADSEPKWSKVLADGTRVPESDPRTDHVAVIDHTRGLMFAVESLGDPDNEDDGITQEHCIQQCKELRLLNHDDWRLPTRSELAGLIDDTRHKPAIDTNLFPRVKPRWHWTSTPAAWSSASACLVDFSYGGVSYGPRDGNGFALAVRRAGQ